MMACVPMIPAARLFFKALVRRCWGLGLLLGVWASGSNAQLQTLPLENLNSLNSRIIIPTCLPSGLSNDNSNLLVVNLPPVDARTLRDKSVSPVTVVTIDLRTPTDGNCASAWQQKASLVFDKALAALAPNTGMLRNTASQYPAGNVLIQVGLFNAQGVFMPVDLRQPLSLRLPSVKPNNLILGVRYVAARAVSLQDPNQLTASAVSDAITPGQVQVQLPFLMKVH